jgi:hypothetical protein
VITIPNIAERLEETIRERNKRLEETREKLNKAHGANKVLKEELRLARENIVRLGNANRLLILRLSEAETESTVGHTNTKQKIQHHLEIKRENNQLKRQVIALEIVPFTLPFLHFSFPFFRCWELICKELQKYTQQTRVRSAVPPREANSATTFSRSSRSTPTTPVQARVQTKLPSKTARTTEDPPKLVRGKENGQHPK